MAGRVGPARGAALRLVLVRLTMVFDFSSAIGGVSASLPLRAVPDLEPRAVSEPGAGFLAGDVLAAVAFFSFFAPIFGTARRGYFLPAFDAGSLGAPDAARLDDALRPALRPCFFSPAACLISLRPGAVFCQTVP